MKVSYYPGCSLEATAKHYNTSVEQVSQALGIEMEDIPDWSCCGSSPALKMNRFLSISLSAFNLAQIEKQGLTDVLVPCPFCFRRLLSAQEEIQQDEELKKRVEQTIEAELEGKLDIHNLLGFLHVKVGLY